MNVNELIDAAEEHAKLYDGDPREDIKTDVLNSFYAGAAFALQKLKKTKTAADRKKLRLSHYQALAEASRQVRDEIDDLYDGFAKTILKSKE
mgnify:CR=1 FL=1